ncbi:MAG: DNA methyltransferase, partial [Hungatella sp.]
MENITLLQGNAMDIIKSIPDKSVDLVLTDPPYNIGKTEWDKIDNYIDWCLSWIKECERVLTDTGSLYIWHNDMNQIPALMEAITHRTDFHFRQLCTWVKPNFRKIAWGAPTEKNNLRNWFNVSEYCLYYIKSDAGSGKTGLKLINSNPECYKPLKEWHFAEIKRLGIEKKILPKNTPRLLGASHICCGIILPTPSLKFRHVKYGRQCTNH